MSIIAIIATLFVIALAALLLAALDSKQRLQRIADQHWHEVEHK